MQRWQEWAWPCASAGSVTVALAVAATTAFACTSIMGPLTFSPSSGPGGTVVMTSATGLKVAPAKYALHFGKTADSDCMAFTGVTTLATVATDSQGSWSNVKVKIPRSASLGAHNFCGMEVYPVKGSTGTAHMVFTVT